MQFGVTCGPYCLISEQRLSPKALFLPGDTNGEDFYAV